ncbi:hypothetical protein H0E87_024974, partial [Populus deltoides]
MEKISGGSPPPPPPLSVPANVNPELVEVPRHPERSAIPKYSMISRCGVGTCGRHISLLTNHYKVSVNVPDAVFYHESGSPGGGESPSAAVKRSKRSYWSKTFKVEISYAAKIPLKSIALALKGIEIDNSTQDALRVLDIILRQQAAN